METSSFRQAIEAQFDCLSKKVIKRAVMKGYRDMKRREKRECSFSDLPDYQQERFGECDKYESDYTVFNVLGIEVWIENDKLSEALKALTEKKRNIILLSYFMDMADGEISRFINIPRSNVQYHRTKSLETLRKYIVSATEGDPEAIATVMNFYDGYISKLCLRKLYDEHGNVCMVVDADLKNRVQTAFLDMILNFEIAVI